jgi:aspartyl-tRNA(Asn)/glutamyl-tRNA(Gln) amidotransferase subunit C
MREDAVTEPDRADALLALAPESRGGLYLVPKVIE